MAHEFVCPPSDRPDIEGRSEVEFTLDSKIADHTDPIAPEDPQNGVTDIEDGLPLDQVAPGYTAVTDPRVMKQAAWKHRVADQGGPAWHVYDLSESDTHGLTAEEINEQYYRDIQESRDAWSEKLRAVGARAVGQSEGRMLVSFEQGLCALGDELGVDLSERLTKPEHVHVCPDRGTYTEAMVTIMGERDRDRIADSGAYTVDRAGIVVQRHREPSGTAYSLSHEKIHDASYRIIWPSVEVDDTGLAKVDTVNSRAWTSTYRSGLVEAVTEMTNHRAWNTRADLPERKQPKYLALSTIMSGIIEDTSRILTVDPQKVERQFSLGLFALDGSGLGMVEEAMGTAVTRVLYRMPRSRRLDGLMETVNKLDQHGQARALRENIRKASEGGYDAVTFYPWR